MRQVLSGTRRKERKTNMSKDGFVLGAGQSHELEMAMNRPENGVWTPKLVYELCQGDRLGKVREVILGFAEIKPIEHLIDCDADPFVPNGWSVQEHRKGGLFRWDPNRVELYLSERQRRGEVRGDELRKELSGRRVLNANVLDFLLKNKQLIPKKWKKRSIFFWGTIYIDSKRYIVVRSLWYGDLCGKYDWHSGCLELPCVWNSLRPAVLEASVSAAA